MLMSAIRSSAVQVVRSLCSITTLAVWQSFLQTDMRTHKNLSLIAVLGNCIDTENKRLMDSAIQLIYMICKFNINQTITKI